MYISCTCFRSEAELAHDGKPADVEWEMLLQARRNSPGTISSPSRRGLPDLAVDKSGRGRPCGGGRDSASAGRPRPDCSRTVQAAPLFAFAHSAPANGPAGCPLDTRLLGPGIASAASGEGEYHAVWRVPVRGRGLPDLAVDKSGRGRPSGGGRDSASAGRPRPDWAGRSKPHPSSPPRIALRRTARPGVHWTPGFRAGPRVSRLRRRRRRRRGSSRRGCG